MYCTLRLFNFFLDNPYLSLSYLADNDLSIFIESGKISDRSYFLDRVHTFMALSSPLSTVRCFLSLSIDNIRGLWALQCARIIVGSSNLENPRRDTGFIKTDRSVNQPGGPRGHGGRRRPSD